jgi:hypothetical protein
MLFILQDEILDVAHIFIDDLPIKGPASAYLDANGTPEVHPENLRIQKFIWEHVVDVHRIIHPRTQVPPFHQARHRFADQKFSL